MTEPAPTLVSFVRHGRVHNPGRVLYGRLPRFGLAAEGLAEARGAGLALAGAPLAAVFTSPQLRARQTARAIAAHHPGLQPRVSRLLQEVLTPYQGRPLAETEAVGDDLYAGAGPGFETPADVARRVLRFVDRVRRRYPGGQVVAVTHGDPLAFLLMAVAGLPLEPGRKASLHRLGVTDGYPATGSVATLSFRPGAAAPRLSYRRPG